MSHHPDSARTDERSAPRRSRWAGAELPFAALAFAFAFTAVFHLVAALRPEVDPDAPAWRHLLFVGINLACIAGLLFRPLPFLFAFFALTLQQLWTHGSHAWRLWSEDARIDWPSIAVVVVMPLTLALLIVDRVRSSGPIRRGA